MDYFFNLALQNICRPTYLIAPGSASARHQAVCNATHSVEARMCRWLLRMYDLTGPELPLTQEFLAQMMGVRRTSVSLVASGLQDAGVIAYRRGHVRVANVEKLKKMACECYEAVNTHYKKIFQVEPPTHSVTSPTHLPQQQRQFGSESSPR